LNPDTPAQFTITEAKAQAIKIYHIPERKMKGGWGRKYTYYTELPDGGYIVHGKVRKYRLPVRYVARNKR
jgi:hypothetical protein